MLFIFQLISVLISWNFLMNVEKMLLHLSLTALWREVVSGETSGCFYGDFRGNHNSPLNSVGDCLWVF